MLFEKKEKMLSPLEQKAKMSVLKGIREKAGDDMLGGLQKVSVMAPDKKGLEKGLGTAQGLLGAEGSMEDSPMEASSEMDKPEEHMSMEELDSKIADLLAMREKMKMEQSSMGDGSDDSM